MASRGRNRIKDAQAPDGRQFGSYPRMTRQSPDEFWLVELPEGIAYYCLLASGTTQEPGRVRVVKLVLTAGTTQACSGGQPASVVGLWQSEDVAGLTREGKTVSSSGSAYT